jgi:hypothetical protein
MPQVSGGRRESVAIRLTHSEVVLLDELRGPQSRSSFLRALIAGAAMRRGEVTGEVEEPGFMAVVARGISATPAPTNAQVVPGPVQSHM